MTRVGKGGRWNVVAYHVHDPNMSFVHADIVQFSKHCNRVLLFTTIEPSARLRALPNVEVVWPAMDWKRYRPVRLFIAHAPALLRIYLSELAATRRWIPLVPALKKLVTNVFRATEVERNCRERGVTDAVHYSFWWYDSIYLAWLKRKGGIPVAVTRTHGGDLYEERGSLDVPCLFRHFQLDAIDAVFSVSEAGTRYLHERYTTYHGRIRTSYMGTADHGLGPVRGTIDPWVIVSCAKVRNIKRVHLIGEALERVEGIHVRWVHFGGTANAERDPTVAQFIRTVDRLRQRPNMEVQLMGFMDNQAIMEWYASNAVDLFVSMSSTEGLPVSMMEAISFGIPVLSTDVGGCREIVNDRTGMLIPLDTAVEEVARIIEGLGKSRFVTSGARADVRAYWQEKFNAEHNYADLFADIGR